MAKLDAYAAMLREWQAAMNLVAPSTIDPMWNRHFADSAQLASLAPESGSVWLDIGSGAGFPALVLALMVSGDFHLVEATGKKCRFLSAVVEALDLTSRVTIHNERIEAMRSIRADIITARACAPLVQLFAWGLPHGDDARWLLMKGRSVEAEVSAAALAFDFQYELVPSRTDPEARIVDARGVRRRQA